MKAKIRSAFALAALLAAASGAAQDGKQVYQQKCAMCHAAGVAGAPRPGNAADWAARLKAGKAEIYANAIQGTPRGMPPKGGQADLSDGAVRAAVDYMLGGATAAKTPAVKPAAARGLEPPPAKAPLQVAQASAPSAALPQPGSGAAEANAFNRLLRPIGRRNLPPAEDGIHDPSVDGTHQLQPPLAAFGALPQSNSGNHVDWVKALEQRRIAPRWERDKADAAPTLMDLNIVRKVKGSMPDVVFSHKQHTEWLDCSNCHPAIFTAQTGSNQMSMAGILLGQGCGACHGRVAFPVSECRLCHSKKKDDAAAGTAAVGAARR